MKRPHRKAILLGALAVGLGAAGAVLLQRDSSSFPPLPVPNGYDGLARAAGGIRGAEDPWKADEPALRTFVDGNRDPLATARVGLDRTCRVPLAASVDGLQAHRDRTGRLRNLGRLLVAAGRLAEREGRRGEALRDYLDAVRLGDAAGRGGLIVDDLVGRAIESIGVRGLLGIRSGLDAGECRRLIAALEPIDSGREPIGAVIARDVSWFRRAGDWRTRVLFTVAPFTFARIRGPADASA